MINLNELPREIRDKIELRESSDSTFYRFCVEENELLWVNGELKKIKEVHEGDKVLSPEGQEINVNNVWKTEKECVEIITDSCQKFAVSQDHRVKTTKGLLKAQELVKGIVLEKGNLSKKQKHYVKGKLPIVEKIIEVGVKKCIDIEVDSKEHLFCLANGVVVHNCDENYTEEFWNILMERANPNEEHSMIASVFGSQGSGKSWGTISMCAFMDPNFTVDNIFFSYNDLVHNRSKLKPHSAVLLDEQTQAYGLDSNRVMIMLNSIKEQLRKKSIHLFFCSPVLHPEAQSSMYIIEIMFIDKENEESIAALKTRENQTLGHIRIPSPLKNISGPGTSLVTKEFMDAYEAKKDEHLEKLLGQKHSDPYEERAEAVMANELFKRAEKMYVKKLGYIPRDRTVQIINKIFPEYNAGVVPHEIAERVRMNRELEGKWEVPGSKKKKK